MKILLTIAIFIVAIWLYKTTKRLISFFKAFYVISKIKKNTGLNTQQSAEVAKKVLKSKHEYLQKKHMEEILKNRLDAEAKMRAVDEETKRKLDEFNRSRQQG